FGSTEEIRTEILLHALKNSPGGRRGLRFVRQQLESLPDSALQSFLTGLIHEISEDLEAAVKAYETAFQLNPADVAALRRTAILNYQMGRTLRASTLIQEVLTLQPDDAGTLLLAGQLALGAENYPLARRYLERCLYRVRQGAALENQSTAHAQLAAVLFALEEEASLIMDHLVPAAADPGNLEWIWRFAQRKIYLLREQDLRKSEQMELGLIGIFEDLSDLDPENPETEWLLGRSQVYRKAYAEALRNFERVQAIAQESENPERWLTDDFYFDWAAALERSGNTGEAVGMFEKIIHRNPEHHSSLNYVAYMWAEQNENLEQALSYVQRALALEPENGSYLDTLAWIYYRQERYEEAYRKLLKCVELIPEESVVAEHLGDVLMKLERPWEAAGYYRIALLLDPAERLAIVEASLERAATALRNQLHAAVQDGNRNR
ncbi:MAG: tetratricopeptide repeat protein, partial [Kiritimatiellia bacterium]